MNPFPTSLEAHLWACKNSKGSCCMLGSPPDQVRGQGLYSVCRNGEYFYFHYGSLTTQRLRKDGKY